MDYIRGSGLRQGVKVGVTDTALWKGAGEFDHARITFPDPNHGETADPLTGNAGWPGWSNTSYVNSDGGHGTGVTSIIGADADDGGTVGVASVLGDKLEISHLDIQDPAYKGTYAVAVPDPNDPTQYTTATGQTRASRALAGLLLQVQNNAKVINMSWGCRTTAAGLPADPQRICDPEEAAAFRRFFQRMCVDHPDVVFVATAGNESAGNRPPREGSRSFPGGAPLPNVITVGNVNNDGTLSGSSNLAGRQLRGHHRRPRRPSGAGRCRRRHPGRRPGRRWAPPPGTPTARRRR